MQINTHTVLTIAGSDPYGGAGIQVDSKVIHALGGYALCVTTALTAQNSLGVLDVLPTPIEHFKIQLYALLDDIKVDAVKIGMLVNAETITVIVGAIIKYKLKNIVLDTVLLSSSGKVFLDILGVENMIKNLFPLVDVITPNIPEVNAFLGTKYEGNKKEIESMAKALFDLGAKAVLIKGGRSKDDKYATDYLVTANTSPIAYTPLRVQTSHTHGTGCVLSSAIAMQLAKGFSLEESVEKSKDFLYQKLCPSLQMVFKYHSENDMRKEPLI